MPNHVFNEIRIPVISEDQAAIIRQMISSNKSPVDFSVLLPVPLYCWMHGVGEEHERTFPNNALAWCSEHWSTKWNAYDDPTCEIEGNDLVLRFQTAWRAPYGWMCALMNKSNLAFSYQYLSEGESVGHVGQFNPDDNIWKNWTERNATAEENDYLGRMLWGDESWASICSERDGAA